MRLRGNLLAHSVVQSGIRILGSACSLVLTWALARRSLDDLGVFRTVFAYFLICEQLPLLGMHVFVIRELSIRPETLSRLLVHSLTLALGVAIVVVCGLGTVSSASLYSPGISHGLLLLAAALPATAVTVVAMSVLIAQGRTTAFSLVQGGETFLRTGIGLVFAALGWPVLGIIAVMVACRWVSVAGYAWLLREAFRALRWTWDRSSFREFVAHVPVFAGISLLALVMRFAPQTLLPWLLDDRAAGQFAAAYVFVDLILLVPTALVTNLAPQFARRAHESLSALADSCRDGIKLVAMGVGPAAAVLCAIAGPLFSSVLHKGESYDVAAQVLAVVIWAAPLLSIDSMVSVTFFSARLQRYDFATLAVGGALTIAALTLVAPHFGLLAAARAVLAALACHAVIRLVLVGRTVGSIQPLASLWRPALATVAAFAAARTAAPLHWLTGAAAGGAAALLVLATCGAFARHERNGILFLLRPKAA